MTSVLKSDVLPKQTNTWSGWPVAIKDEWGMLGRALAKMELHSITREKLLTKLQIQWEKISRQVIKKLFRSMRGLRECTTKRDGHPHYWSHFCHFFSCTPTWLNWSVDLIWTWCWIIFVFLYPNTANFTRHVFLHLSIYLFFKENDINFNILNFCPPVYIHNASLEWYVRFQHKSLNMCDLIEK